MRKVWIVAADGCRARVFYAENATKIREVTTLEHPPSRLANHELVSDKAGKSTQKKSGYPHSLEPEASPKQNEKDHFAKDLAAFLENGWNKKEFERLYLIASIQFSGMLHHHLSPQMEKMISQEIHKDLTSMDPEEIRDYLPPVL